MLRKRRLGATRRLSRQLQTQTINPRESLIRTLSNRRPLRWRPPQLNLKYIQGAS